MTKEIKLEWQSSQGGYFTVWVEVGYSFHSIGIGSYEFWGYKGYDDRVEVIIDTLEIISVEDDYGNPCILNSNEEHECLAWAEIEVYNNPEKYLEEDEVGWD